MELKDIRAIVELMKKNDLTVFELEREKFRIKIQREAAGRIGAPEVSAPLPAPEPGVAAAEKGAEGPAREILAPMVGTLYRSSAPDAPAFVEVGDVVSAESVVCIIEAMKVMNEIRAEMAGVIAEVLVENGKPVHYGQPLFRLR